MLHYQTLEPSSFHVLHELMDMLVLKEAGFHLAGGTALALQLGHRMSTDVDLFTPKGIDPRRIKAILEKEFGGRIDVYTVTDLGVRCFIDEVKVDMIHFPYKNVNKPLTEEGIRYLPVADIAAMKVHAVANRGARRDFVDLAEILQIMPLNQVMEAYKAQFNPARQALAHTSRALTYFKDAETTPDVLNSLNKRTWEQTKLIVGRSVRSPAVIQTSKPPKPAVASNPHVKKGRSAVPLPTTTPALGQPRIERSLPATSTAQANGSDMGSRKVAPPVTEQMVPGQRQPGKPKLRLR